MTSKEKCECGHDLYDGERCRTAISVLPMKQCTCRWSRPAAWQNAAESLPAEPEQESCQHCGLPIRKTGMDRVRNEWEHLDGMSYCKGASTYAWPIAPVEAKEKEQCPNCNHKAHFALRCGALIATGSGQEWDGDIFCECLNWVAESKPTPSTPDEPHKNGWHYGYITCSCGWAWDSRNTLTGSLATQHGLRIFEKHKAEVSKPQPDSSSIPDLKPWLDQAVDLLNLYHSGYCPKDGAKGFLEKCKLNFGNVAEYKPFVDSSSIPEQDETQNLRYAQQLVTSMASKHFPEVIQFKPLTGDMFGLLMQIDNMLTGMQRVPQVRDSSSINTEQTFIPLAEIAYIYFMRHFMGQTVDMDNLSGSVHVHVLAKEFDAVWVAAKGQSNGR